MKKKNSNIEMYLRLLMLCLVTISYPAVSFGAAAGGNMIKEDLMSMVSRGFPELLPRAQISFNNVKKIIEKSFDKYGYAPLETPVIEQVKTFTSKGIEDKEVYGLRRLRAELGDEGAKDVALRFDHTVPLARYVAEHKADLIFPFRRQSIGKVWRGEKPSRGRYREFYQCDIDIVGNGKLGLAHDAEPPSIINEIFEQLPIGEFIIRINNRKLLQGLFANWLNTEDPIATKAVLKIIDNMDKVDESQTTASLKKIGLQEATATSLVQLIKGAQTNEETFSRLNEMAVTDSARKGLEELKFVYEQILALGVPKKRLKIDISVARGLDYYTGTIYETTLLSDADIGSICSGGRYDNLTSLYGGAQYPGVGMSIGLSRLFSIFLEKDLISKTASVAPVIITCQDEKFLSSYQQIAKNLRGESINTEVYYNSDKLSKQLTFASKKGIKLAIIAREEEFAHNVVNVKNLETGEQVAVSLDTLTAYIKLNV